ncbi:MAG: cobyrinate a,c-diamide synthase [Chloroflexota bacterium]
MNHIPRLVIAGQSSGVGKTTITVGLNAALSRQGRIVQPFKCGPDYIDPMYHTMAARRVCRNLDTWMVEKEQVKQSFTQATQGAEIGLVEGVMGLYDGYEALTEAGSTAEVAKLIQAPIILVVNVAKMARSVGAIALGYRDFDPQVQISGVICNNVASDRHAQWVTEAVESIGLPVLGCIPRDQALHIPERHLGLLTAVERQAEVATFLEESANLISQHIDLERVWGVASSALEDEASYPQGHKMGSPTYSSEVIPSEKMNTPIAGGEQPRIAVAYDEAFCFYYEDNFDFLRAAGATICHFSPLHDKTLPADVSALYLGGGYPELYAAQLSANPGMMDAIRQAIHSEMPIYAECGGLMVLTEAIIDLHGKTHPMLGVLSGYIVMEKRVRLGYREVAAVQDTPLLKAGERARGHEFHYSRWMRDETDPHFQHAYSVTPRRDEAAWHEGALLDNLLASYVHLHFGSNPRMAERFVEQSRRHQKKQVRNP